MATKTYRPYYYELKVYTTRAMVTQLKISAYRFTGTRDKTE